jgi:hypothetical protein
VPLRRPALEGMTPIRTLSFSLLAAWLCAAILSGCGDSGKASSTATARAPSVAKKPKFGEPFQPAGDKVTPQNATITAHAKSACERAVRSAPALAAPAKAEIARLCFRINYVQEDNERTVRAICQEVANASSPASDLARKRTAAACYAVGMG